MVPNEREDTQRVDYRHRSFLELAIYSYDLVIGSPVDFFWSPVSERNCDTADDQSLDQKAQLRSKVHQTRFGLD